MGKYPDLDFSFLGEGILGVIEGFKAKPIEEAIPITEIPDDETQQVSDMVQELMDEDERRDE